jgi:probable HAF family extracellular repeat protein
VTNITFGFGGPGVIGYIDLDNQFGSGSFSFRPAPVRYTVTDLGTLPGDTDSLGFALNNSGQVVGVSSHVPVEVAILNAFLWDADNGMQGLGPAGLYDGDVATALNRQGEIAGVSYDQGTTHAFLWTGDAGFLDLGFTLARALNDATQIGGYAIDPQSRVARAVLWDGVDGPRDLGTFADHVTARRPTSTTQPRSSASQD